MNREQMEAWCALEGIGPHIFGLGRDEHRYLMRITYVRYGKHCPMLTYRTGSWRMDTTGNGISSYIAITWAEVPEELRRELTIELLTELTKK